MKKTVLIFTLSLILATALMFSCGGGGGGGVDNAIDETVTITYNANGADSGRVPESSYGYGDDPIYIVDNMYALEKSGYLFDGWNTEANGQGTDYAPGSYSKGRNITLYAKWAAIFNVEVIPPASPAPALDGAQKSPGVPYLKILGLTAKGRTLANINIPTAIDGYSVISIGSGAFQGCDTFTELTIPETVTAIENNAFAGCTGLTDLTIPRSVTSIGNGAFSGCISLFRIILCSKIPPTMGTEVLYDCSATVCVPLSGVDGYKAAEGWDIYSSQIEGYRDETFTVTFDGQKATTAATPAIKAVVPPDVTVGQLPNPPVRIGYNFGGWYTEPEGAGNVFTANTEVTSNITVYAKWNEYNYTVTFNDQGATTPVGEPSKSVVSPNTTVGTLPTAPANTGYHFMGWNTKSDGTGTYFDANTLVTGDTTVYAIWMANPSFTVTFDSQGASNYITRQIKVISPNTTTGYLPTDPIKKGFSFNGWYTGREGTGQKFTASTVVTGNITVYASWTALIRYEINGMNATITGLTTEGRALSQIQIPETIDTYTVTAIGSYAFEDCSNITSISLPDTIASIGDYAFYRCSNLASINLPDGLPNIGNKSFYQCTKLTNITLPESITAIREAAFYQSGLTSIKIPASVVSIGEDAFTNCDSLKTVIISDYAVKNFGSVFRYNRISNITILNGVTTIYDHAFSGYSTISNVVIPNSVTSIGDQAFYGCTGLTSITIPNSVINIGNSTFYGCTGLTSITIPNSVKNIGGGSFSWSGLTSITIPNSVTNIGNYTFESCMGLTSVTISNSMTSIGDHVFGGCCNLKNVIIPNSVKNIGDYAFSGCSMLTSITIPNSVISIGNYAFYGSGLTSITIPNSVTSIGDYAFDYCSALTNVIIGNSVTSIGNYAFNECSTLASVTIGNKVTSIGNYAFNNCDKLTSITIPDSVTSIGDYAFYDCSTLSGVTIGNRVTSIGDYAFKSCGMLASVTIGNRVTSIGNHAFAWCRKLKSITLPGSITSIGDCVFYESMLSSIWVNNTTPPSIGNDVFGRTYLSKIYVPSSSVGTYKTADGWSEYANKIVADE